MTTGRAASVHARLVSLARTRGTDPNRLLERYAIERWLYRLSVSKHRESLCLKGALLFDLWFDAAHRPTRDADFLGFGSPEASELESLVSAVCAVAADDGLSFDLESLEISEIREDARYGGLRVKLKAQLGTGRIPMQLDVGYGDAVTPGIEEAAFPTLFGDSPPPRLKVYPRATVVAEKLEAIASLGMPNSRMKDYFDLFALAHEGKLDVPVLADAVWATFRRRGTPLPAGLPIGLTVAFAENADKLTQWNAFLRKSGLEGPSLGVVVTKLGTFLEEPLQRARRRTP